MRKLKSREMKSLKNGELISALEEASALEERYEKCFESLPHGFDHSARRLLDDAQHNMDLCREELLRRLGDPSD